MARKSMKMPKSVAGLLPVAIVAILAILAILAVMYLRPKREHFGKWKKVADETKNFYMENTAKTRFGAGDKWVNKEVKGHVACTNITYGRDPAPGVLKTCEKLYLS
jgi:hypothetical protein